MQKFILHTGLVLLIFSCQTQHLEMGPQPDFSQYDYLEQVINYTMEDINKTVVLDNPDYRLFLQPNLIFNLQIKDDGKLIKGRWTYRMNLSTEEGLMYLLILDKPESMTKKEFLNESNYTLNSDIILLPNGITENLVRYAIKKSNVLFNSDILLFRKSFKEKD